MARSPTRDECRGQRNRRIPASWSIKLGALPSLCRTLGVVVCRIPFLHLSGWCGRCPKSGNNYVYTALIVLDVHRGTAPLSLDARNISGCGNIDDKVENSGAQPSSCATSGPIGASGPSTGIGDRGAVRLDSPFAPNSMRSSSSGRSTCAKKIRSINCSICPSKLATRSPVDVLT